MFKYGNVWHAMADRKEILTSSPNKNPQVLFLYFSFSGQTGVLVNRLAAGLKEQGVEVFFEKLKPVKHLRFPVGGILRTFVMMLTTLYISLLLPRCLPADVTEHWLEQRSTASNKPPQSFPEESDIPCKPPGGLRTVF